MTGSRRLRMPSRLTRVVVATSVAAATAVGAAAAVSSSAAQAAAPTPAAAPQIHRTALTTAQIAQYSKDPSQRVIVLMRNQLTGALGGGAASLRARSSELSQSQQSIRAELAGLHAPNLRAYHFLNAISAEVSGLEAKRLAADPQVLAVVPDREVTLPASNADSGAAVGASSAPAVSPQVNAVNRTSGLCGTARAPLQEPEALSQIGIGTTGIGYTGAGVKVAVFPDGLDPNMKDFIRPNGTHAIFDYKDFSGDGPSAVTDGGEAFGDASSIIAQGRVTYDQSRIVDTNLPLPSPCSITVKGVAPGASLAVMKVFGDGAAFDSVILQAMEYAVEVDQVDVLSESFGGNPLPDPATDPISLFNDLAVQFGITVVASSGDAGATNTIGSPASSNGGVISAGATTSFRTYAQLSEHGYQLGGDKGWESNNIATLSSGGFTDYGPNSVDVVAPGDSNWAICSVNISVYQDCAAPYAGASHANGTELFGGTSEACPLTAGTAALVIQAYRSSHKNVTPSPALVKQIIMSTASDLGAPVIEQGAGQVDARRAVQAARSYGLTPTGYGTVFSPNKIETTGVPGSAHTATVTVRNTTQRTRAIAPTLQQFNTPTTIASGAVDYEPGLSSTPTFTYWLDGNPEPYVEQDFTVPAGYQRLTARFSYAADQTAPYEVFEVLFDPSGRVAQDTDPQGAAGGFGQGDVRNPQPGTWRAIFFSRPGSAAKYSGPINFQDTVQKRTATARGAISPSNRTLKPGASGTFSVTYPTPTTPGDGSLGVNFGSLIGVLPILTRSVATPTASRPATFTGEVTTGNARMAQPSQVLPYQFDIPAGMRDVDIDVHVAVAGYLVGGQLLAPRQAPVETSTTDFDDITTSTPTTTATQNLHLSWRDPVAGRWGILLFTIGGSAASLASGSVSTTVIGTISFNTVAVTSTGVPDSAGTQLTAGSSSTANVTITNTGNSPRTYFIDPRRAGRSTYSLGFLNAPDVSLPIYDPNLTPLALVPPASTTLSMVVNATAPTVFVTSPQYGSPEIDSTVGTTSLATLSAAFIPPSDWACQPALLGPFAGPTVGATAACAAFAVTDTIDDTVSARGGNIWDTASDPNSVNVFDPTSAVVVQPGQSTTIPVTFTASPDDVDGVVSGYLDVQSYDDIAVSGDDLERIPYVYSVVGP